jgi:hypothetical protein
MIRLFMPLSLTLMTIATYAQTKVFKEVGEDIATQIKAITQDNALVGYLAFTRLEKTDADSFNYRVTVMDENLNDIGTVNFRQRNLELLSVSFEQDVLCLGYVESAMVGVLTGKEARQAYRHSNHENLILLQFISLSGKIINKFTSPVTLSSNPVAVGSSWTYHMASYLKNGMQIKNVPGAGFAVFYGDESKRELLLLDAGGKLIRRRKIVADVPGYLLETSGSNIYLLTKMHINPAEGGYRLYTYTTTDSVKELVTDLKDKQGNWFKVLSFDNDPATGKTFIAGCVINPDRQKDFITAHDLAKNPYLGLFSMTLGATQADMKTTYTYWANASIPGITEDGLFTSTDNEFFARYATAFRDYNGTTVFVASALVQKRLLGAAKYKFADAVFVTQDGKGQLKLDNHIPCDESSYFGPAGQLDQLDHKDFYKVVNQDTKTNFIIVDDATNIYIYNFSSKKLMRTISHKDGRTIVRVFPAKEGHILVSEFNNKEKQTRFSIESL